MNANKMSARWCFLTFLFNACSADDACTAGPLQSIDCSDSDLANGTLSGITSPSTCCNRCSNLTGCRAWTVYPELAVCYLKSDCRGLIGKEGAVSGGVSTCMYKPTSGIDCKDSDLPGGSTPGVTDPDRCCALCSGTIGCKAWTLYPDKAMCYLKSDCKGYLPKQGAISGGEYPEPAPAGREGAMLWVTHDNDNDGKPYSSLLNWIATTAVDAGVTAVSFCAYDLLSDGTLGYASQSWQPKSGINQEMLGIVPLRNLSSIKQFPKIGSQFTKLPALRLMMGDAGRRAKFISQAIDKLQKLQLDGFNLDFEIPPAATNATDGRLFKQFITEFSNALHNAGAQLSSDITACGDSAKFMHVSCTDYALSRIDHVVTMKTYTKDITEYSRLVPEAAASLGLDKLSVGLVTGIPDDQVDAFFQVANDEHVRTVSLWACWDSPCFSSKFADTMRAFFRGS